MNTTTCCREIIVNGQPYGDCPSEAWDKVHATPTSTPLHIEDRIYEALAQEFREKIGARDYIKTTVEVKEGDRFFRLTLTAILYRRTECRPEGTVDVVSDVVPMWWELHSFIDEEEVLNDASFVCLKLHIIE